MIASRGPCYRDRLERLLNSELSIDEEYVVTAHLDHCELCRDALQDLTGPVELWQETRSTLSETTELGEFPKPQRQEGGLHEDTARWVKTLLSPSSDPQMLGELDGRQVQSIIGQGGMGVVVKVWDAQLHRPLAVKLLSPMLASTGAARQRFFREAQAAAAVVHPNIVPIYAVTSEGPLPYIVMPLVGGGSLQQRIEREGPLAITDILSIGLQIAEALSAAHGQGLVHRDIKPANILLDEGGHRVMLSDFGLARALDDASMTASGMIAGTPNYMSPEQARGETVDARSDLYSLGAVLYTMATGHPPARGDTPLAVLRRVTDEQPRVVHSVNEAMPIWLDRVINRFLEKALDHRIRSAESAADLLRGCLAHLRVPARNPLPKDVQVTRHWSKKFAVIAAIASVFVLGLSVALLNQSPKTKATNGMLQGDAAQSLTAESGAVIGSAINSGAMNHMFAPSTAAEPILMERNGLAISSVFEDGLDAKLDSIETQLRALQQELQ